MTVLDQLRLANPDCIAAVTIDGEPLNNAFGAWLTPDLSVLTGDPEQRGSDRLIPGIQGVRAYKRRSTVTRYSLPLLVTGAVRYDGTLAASWSDFDGLLVANLRRLKTNVTLPTNAGDGTRSVTVDWADGTSITVDAHCGPLRGTIRPRAILRATLELSVPGGEDFVYDAA